MKKILLVDDDGIAMLFSKRIIKRVNSEIIIDECLDPLTALHKLEKNQYDLIIVDINMPIMNGFEFVNLVQSTNPDQKIIISSSSISPEDANKAKELKCIFITKPLTNEIIINILTSIT
jgi:two-component SAPR family response regulator